MTRFGVRGPHARLESVEKRYGDVVAVEGIGPVYAAQRRSQRMPLSGPTT